MINSGSSELKQIVRGNIPPNVYFSEEEHVQMFSGACPRHITKAMLRAMLMPRQFLPSHLITSVGASIGCADASSSVK